MTTTVTSAHFVRHIADLKRQAVREPVFVTSHGHATHVLVTAEHYRGLISPPNQTILDSDAFRLLVASLDAGFLACNAATAVVAVNPITAAITGRASQMLVGLPLFDALPELAGTVLETHFRRTLAAGEPTRLDLPSPFREANFLRVQCLPLEGGVAMIWRDITEEVRRHRLADVKEALLLGMELHGGLAYARLTLRGMIKRITQSFAHMVGLPTDRLAGVAMADLIPITRRVTFKAALNAVLEGEGDLALDTALLANSGQEVEVRVAVVALRGLYGNEGAAVIVTPRE